MNSLLIQIFLNVNFILLKKFFQNKINKARLNFKNTEKWLHLPQFFRKSKFNFIEIWLYLSVISHFPNIPFY